MLFSIIFSIEHNKNESHFFYHCITITIIMLVVNIHNKSTGMDLNIEQEYKIDLK